LGLVLARFLLAGGGEQDWLAHAGRDKVSKASEVTNRTLSVSLKQYNFNIKLAYSFHQTFYYLHLQKIKPDTNHL
jgi:hypothetical protein